MTMKKKIKRRVGLTAKQARFVDHYFADPKRHLTNAYIKAGYSPIRAYDKSSHLRNHHSNVKEAFEKRIKASRTKNERRIEGLIETAYAYRDRAADEGDYRTALQANDQIAKLIDAYPINKGNGGSVTINLQTLLATLPPDEEPIDISRLETANVKRIAS